MKTVKNIIYSCAMLAMCCACSLKEDAFVPERNDSIFQFTAAVAGYSEHNVSTRASSDTDIKELTMLIFTADGDIVGRPVNIMGSNPTFLVDTKEKYIWDPNATGDDQYVPITNGDENLHACDIYMVANSWETLGNLDITTLQQLKEVSIPVAGIDVPENGFPMIGKQSEGMTFDLAENKVNGSTNGSTLATITMTKLYAKVVVRFCVIADQVVATPTFTLTDWQVCNIPGTVSFGEPESGQPTANTSSVYISNSQRSNVITGGVDRVIEHTVSGTDYFEISFYMPEHHLYAPKDETNFNYPSGLPVANRQRYKPLLCGESQKPTYVKIHGSYKDHQGNATEVVYNLYLGQDPVDDFCVKRNQLLSNVITIKGVTDRNPYYDKDGGLAYPDNYDPAGDNISVDHRVEIGSQGFVIAMEREAVMDSHFEVRPMDITVSDGARVVVTIDDDSNTDPNKVTWMRFENGGSSDDHISGVGVRKYFTTDLVTTTLNAAANKTLTITDDTRLWLYFDQNTNVYDSFLDTDEENPLSKWRDVKLVVDYYASDNATSTPTQRNIYTFRQWHLWRIRDESNTRYYDIEHEEEYLYNYASDDNYGKTTDGMEWGLIENEDLTLSEFYDAIYVDGNLVDDWATSFVKNSGLNPKYDFYLPRDLKTTIQKNNLTSHEFAGQKFTNQIAYLSGISSNIGNLVLNADPNSAIEYCLNKNKRNPSGGLSITRTQTNDNSAPEYNSTDVKWFLPSIDQIEEIVIGGYQSFDVFHDKYYWSSQPGYKIYELRYTFFSTSYGNFYTDNDGMARATKVDDNLQSENSEDTVPEYYYHYSVFGGGLNGPTRTNSSYDDIEQGKGPGYQSRTEINRIRCVYRSGLVSEL